MRAARHHTVSFGGAMDDASIPACLSCGTCCFSHLDRYVAVTGDDHQRLGDSAEELTHFIGNRAYMRMTEGHCAALRVDAASRTFVCTVYELRPATCRDLGRGTPECLGELGSKADRPLVAVRRLTDRLS
jgi:hypothetical protein